MQRRRSDVFLSYNHADSDAVEGIARRLARRLGDPAIVTALLILFGPSAFGDTPDTRDTNQFMADWFVTKRTSVMVGATILALGLLAFLWFVGRGSAAARSATVAVTLMLGGEILVLAALAYVIAAEAPESVKALFELTLVTIPIVAPFLAVVPATVAWSLRSDPDVPRWFVVVSAVAAVAIAVPTVGYAYSGPLSPDVGLQIVVQGLILWLLAAGIAWPAYGRLRPR
jgi:hypothetical protein